MEQMIIRFSPGTKEHCCALCKQALGAGPRLRLFREESDQEICPACGKKEEAYLASLLELAGAAERLGKVCRHMLVPPMEALLDLARAAEEYLHSTAGARERAA